MGILAGTILYPSISESRKKKFSLWGVRVVMLVLIIVAFTLTTKNFCESTHPRFFGVDVRQLTSCLVDTDDPVCHASSIVDKIGADMTECGLSLVQILIVYTYRRKRPMSRNSKSLPLSPPPK